jgi:hypothetical protein
VIASSRLERLPHESLACEALEEVEQVQNAWHRSRATRGLARHLNQRQLSQAAGLAVSGRRPEWRAAALAAIACHTDEPERTSVLAQALAAARSVSDLPRRLWLLLLATGAMTPVEWAALSREVMAGLRAVVDSTELATLLPEVPEPWLEEAAQIAGQLEPAWIRAETWASLAERMGVDRREAWAGRAVAATRGVIEPTERARCLAAVISIAKPPEQEGLAWAALDAAQGMQDEGTLSVTLGILAGAMSADQESMAWALANSMARQELRIPALARLASRWRGGDQADRVRDSAQAWGDTPDEWARSSAIVRIWDHLLPAGREAALAEGRFVPGSVGARGPTGFLGRARNEGIGAFDSAGGAERRPLRPVRMDAEPSPHSHPGSPRGVRSAYPGEFRGRPPHSSSLRAVIGPG